MNNNENNIGNQEVVNNGLQEQGTPNNNIGNGNPLGVNNNQPNVNVNHLNTNPNNQLPNENFNSPIIPVNDNGNKKNIMKIGGIILGIFVIIGIIFMLTSKKDASTSGDESFKENESFQEYKTRIKKESMDLAKKIEIKEAAKFQSGGMLFSFKNKNDVPVILQVSLIEYDSDNVIISNNNLYTSCIQPGSTIYKYDSFKENMHKYEFQTDKAEATKVDNCLEENEDYTYRIENSEDDVYAYVENKTNNIIDVSGVALFYKEGKIIDYDLFSMYDIPAKQTAKEDIVFYVSGYDEIKLSISAAKQRK